ncbi:MAG: arginase, partial [Treponema sp.]|nr:arginase [Treponema sp.]
MNVNIIEMPLDFGGRRHGSDMGPSAIRLAGIKDKIQSLGHTVVPPAPPIPVVPQEYADEGNNPKAKYL